MVDEEPTTEAAVAAWISDELLARDPFVNVADASDEHRVGHEGCEAFPSRPGHLFAVLAASIGARRVLEVGGGLGYSTLWLASGVGPEGGSRRSRGMRRTPSCCAAPWRRMVTRKR
jgi:predicted O-methyltransferase YrrM